MDKRDDFELTPAERAAFDSLPSEALPSRSLEERIVRALKEDGTLKGAVVPPKSPWRLVFHQRNEVSSRRIRLWPVVAGSMAASLLLLGGGVFIGQRMEARSTERILSAIREHDKARIAERVQETGSAYVNALAALEKLRADAEQTKAGNAAPSAQQIREIQQGSEAALGALYGAAIELSHITPGDPHISRMLQILEERRFRETRFEALKEGRI